ERRNEVVAFGVSGQQHGLVTLDHRNQPLRPAKLWCDTSTAPEAEKLNRALGNVDELIRSTGNAMVPGYTAPKILWLKENEPKNFTHTRTILLPHDFLNFWLAGERLRHVIARCPVACLVGAARRFYRQGFAGEVSAASFLYSTGRFAPLNLT